MSSNINFTAILRDAGIPTTKAELETIWQSTIVSTGSVISNDSVMSPFWRLITACVTNPVLWLVNFIAVTVMPNAYVKFATGDYLDVLADAVNLTRKPATPAKGVITFTRSSTAVNATIPLDFIIQTASINGVAYQLKTTESKSFSTGSLTVLVNVESVGVGSQFNLAAGYYAVLPTIMSGISAVNGLNWLTSIGTDIESDEDLRARVRNQFGTATKFHTDAVYKSLIAEFAGISIDAIWIEHNAPRGAGTANAWVLFDFSANASVFLATINNFITDQGHHGHGDDLIVYQMPEQDTTLNVSVWVEDYVDDAGKTLIHNNVVTMINCAFRENTVYQVTKTLPYNRFSFSKLNEEIHNEFSAIHSIDFNSDDIVTGLWIPRLTSLIVTVLSTE